MKLLEIFQFANITSNSSCLIKEYLSVDAATHTCKLVPSLDHLLASSLMKHEARIEKMMEVYCVPSFEGQINNSFCIFPKVKSIGYSPRNTPIYLNVYDLTPMNGYVYWVGLGIFHFGVEGHGVEYAFGAHDYPTSGVFEV